MQNTNAAGADRLFISYHVLLGIEGFVQKSVTSTCKFAAFHVYGSGLEALCKSEQQRADTAGAPNDGHSAGQDGAPCHDQRIWHVKSQDLINQRLWISAGVGSRPAGADLADAFALF